MVYSCSEKRFVISTVLKSLRSITVFCTTRTGMLCSGDVWPYKTVETRKYDLWFDHFRINAGRLVHPDICSSRQHKYSILIGGQLDRAISEMVTVDPSSVIKLLNLFLVLVVHTSPSLCIRENPFVQPLASSVLFEGPRR